MLINAQPRRVSFGFGSFVPTHYTQQIRSGISEMKGNEVSARSTLGSTTMSQTVHGSCNYYTGTGDDENFYQKTFYHRESNEGLQIQPADIHKRVSTSSRATEAHLKSSQQTPLSTGVRTPPVQYNQGNTYMNFDEFAGPNLDYQSYDWTLGSDFGRFLAPVSPTQTFLGQEQFTHIDMVSVPLPSQKLNCSLYGGSAHFENCRGSPNVVYSCFSPMPDIATDIVTTSFVAADLQEETVENWWADLAGNAGGDMQVLDKAYLMHDGLPRDFEPWIPSPGPPSSPHRSLHCCAPLATISPKTLSRPSGLSMSHGHLSLESSTTKTQTASTLAANSPMLSFSTPVAFGATAHQTRRKLPSNPVAYARSASKRQQQGSSKHKQKVSLLMETIGSLKSTIHPRTKVNSVSPKRYVKKRQLQAKPSEHIDNDQQSRASARVVPKSGADATLTTNDPVAIPCHESKDEFLVRSKLAGMSYKDIRQRGGFTEAESTLRGRFRTLTKDKEERVRRPAWTDNDNRLLKRAVRKLTHGQDQSKIKVPWKKVAEYIFKAGGSYQFGNATCRKRWDDLQDRASS